MDSKIAEYLQKREVGDAELFVELIKDSHCYDQYNNRWYGWNGKYWQEEANQGMLSVVDEVVACYEKEVRSASREYREKLERRIDTLNTYRKRTSVVKIVESILSQEEGIKWDSHPWMMPCENGVINLKNGELMEGKPEDYQRAYCPTTYRGLRVTCPRWDQFLLEIMDGDATMVGYLRRLIGYALSGTASEGVFPVLWGRGRNGKGTMLEVLGKVLGGFATPVSSALLLEQTYSRSSAAPSPDLMKLQGKRLVWANETDEGRKLSTAIVKWLVGGDTITARAPYGKEEVSFRPTHTLFLLTNHKPQVDANDYALWQRLHLIPFKLSYVDYPTKPDERKRDLDLMRRFTNIEDQGILTWAVRGCLEWQEYGLIPPRTVTSAIQEYAEEEDYMMEFLSDETLPAEKDEWTRALDVYQRYRSWATARGMVPVTMSRFGRNLALKIIRRRKKGGNEYNLWLRG